MILVLSLSLKLNKKDVQFHKKSIHVVISILAMLPQLENLEQLLTRPRANKNFVAMLEGLYVRVYVIFCRSGYLSNEWLQVQEDDLIYWLVHYQV